MREGIITNLQDRIRHNRITVETLRSECEKHQLDLHEDILAPLGYNTCDRCGDYGDSEMDFLWVDMFPWEDNNPDDQATLKCINLEGVDYCALCWKCINKLKKKGRNEIRTNS